MRVVKHIAVVKFISAIPGLKLNNKKYNFITDISDLKEGDIVFVDTKFGEQKATFLQYDDDSYIKETGNKRASKWLIRKVT